MTTQIQLTYCGMDGAGKNVTEAKQDAARKIEQLVSDLRSPPEIIMVGAFAALIYRDAYGWSYTIIADDSGLRSRQNGTSSGDDTREETRRRAVIHLAQLAWSHDVPDDHAYFQRVTGPYLRADNGRTVAELCDYTRFQRAYKRLKDQGASDAEAHDRACRERFAA